MNSPDKIFKIFDAIHNSEKTLFSRKKNNVFVFRVVRRATKKDIKRAAHALFGVSVERVNTVLVKGKKKRIRNRLVQKKSWKKAYVFLRTRKESINIAS